MEEIWKNIQDYNGYQVSNRGRVRTHKKTSNNKKHNIRKWEDRILKYKGQTYNTGYKVDLWKDGKPKTFLVARLVAFTFYEKDINDHSLTVDHIDGNRFNNNIENLDLVSLKENIQRGFANGLYSSVSKKIKLTDKESGETLIFESMTRASKYIKKGNSYISDAIRNNKLENKKFKWEVI